MPANTAQRYREFARDTQDESPASFAITVVEDDDLRDEG